MGHRCFRINLRFGDWLFWRRRGAINYRGSLQKWSEYLSAFFDEYAVTDLVLLGEQREHHKIAVDLANLRGIHVTVTDWGYLRPDWITLERNGMSGNTHFTKDPEEILQLGAIMPEPDMAVRYQESFAKLTFNNVCGDISSWLFGFLYPGYRSYLPNNPVAGYISTGLRLIRTRRREKFIKQSIKHWTGCAGEKPYYVFPLQMEGDFQVRAYSRYSDLYVAINEVIASFARNAPSHSLLIIKLHPWDTGLRAWRRMSLDIARRLGVQSRVEFIDGGSLDELINGAAGMVTINSTCGVSAIKLGLPVKTLGACLYDIPGLTFQGHLDDFWSQAEPPQAELRDAFIRAIAGCIQIKGGFFSEKGLAAAVEESAQRLANGWINQPVSHAVDMPTARKSSTDFESIKPLIIS